MNDVLKVFISQKSRAGIKAKKVVEKLAAVIDEMNGFKSFSTNKEGQIGPTNKISKKIEMEIKESATAIVIFTKNYMKSKFCRTELRQIQKKFKNCYLPVRIDATKGEMEDRFNDLYYDDLRSKKGSDVDEDIEKLVTRITKWLIDFRPKKSNAKKEGESEELKSFINESAENLKFYVDPKMPKYKRAKTPASVFVSANNDEQHTFPHLYCYYEERTVNGEDRKKIEELIENEWQGVEPKFWDIASESENIDSLDEKKKEILRRVNLVPNGHITPWMKARIPRYVVPDDKFTIGILALAIMIIKLNGKAVLDVIYWESKELRALPNLKKT